ncbi:hypothetical protein GQ457_11G022100 [Hibiscus cannabinus]
MPSCYASYHHRTICHRLISYPTKSMSISRLTQHFTKVEATTHSGSPRSSHDALSGMLRQREELESPKPIYIKQVEEYQPTQPPLLILKPFRS